MRVPLLHRGRKDPAPAEAGPQEEAAPERDTAAPADDGMARYDNTPDDQSDDPNAEAIPPVNQVEGGPETPLEIDKGSWLTTLKLTFKKYSKDRGGITAGSLAYQWFLALFPALIAMLGVVAVVNFQASTVRKLLNGLTTALPGSAGKVFTDAIKQATLSSPKGSAITIVIGLVLAIWSASGGMAALETGLDVAYEVPQSRKFIAKRLRAFPLMLATVVLGGIAAALLVFGAPIGQGISSHVFLSGLAFNVVWTIVRWAVTIIAITVLFSFYYYFGPNRESPKWQWVSPGGILATVVFLVASLGLSIYVANFGQSSYLKTYGTFAGVVLLLLWLYVVAVAVLLGGELNAETERQAAAEAGHPGARASREELKSGT
jgi:membrane protein